MLLARTYTGDRYQLAANHIPVCVCDCAMLLCAIHDTELQGCAAKIKSALPLQAKVNGPTVGPQ